MKMLGKLVLFLLLFCWGAIFSCYFLLQTPFGANAASYWLSKYSGYQISIENIAYNLFRWDQITANGIKINETNKIPILIAKRIDVIFDKSQLTNLTLIHKSRKITITNGQITLTAKSLKKTSEYTRYLQLINTAARFDDPPMNITASRLNGGVLMYHSNDKSTIDFRFTAENASVSNILLDKIFIKGKQYDDIFYLDYLGGNVGKGNFSLKARRYHNRWIIDNLDLHNLHYKTDEHFDIASNMNQFMSNLPEINVQHARIINSNIESHILNLYQFNASVKNVTFYQNHWQTNSGEIIADADYATYHNENFTQPSMQLTLQNDTVYLNKLSTYWREGIVQTSGYFSQRHLTLETLLFAKLRTELPKNWNDFSHYSLPDKLQQLTIKRFIVTPSIIIDSRPDFPFQFTGIEANGENIVINQKQTQPQIERGKITVNATHATLNTVTLRYLNAFFDVQPSTITLKNASALLDKGLLDVDATIIRQPSHPITLLLNGHNANIQLINQWKLIKTPLLAKPANFKLSLYGKASDILQLNGKLMLSYLNNDVMTQIIQIGHLLP